MNSISAEELRTWIVSGKEFALIDIRKKGEFAMVDFVIDITTAVVAVLTTCNDCNGFQRVARHLGTYINRTAS